MKKHEKSADEVRAEIVEFWQAVLMAALTFAVMVTCVFVTSKVAWKREQERLELMEKQKQVEKMNKINVITFVNGWTIGMQSDRGSMQMRCRTILRPGSVYEIGRLREYDSLDVEKNEVGFDHVIEVNTDDANFLNPVITVRYPKLIHVKYSIDGGGGWMISGPTRKGLKTSEYLYTLPDESECETSMKAEGWGEKALTFTVPINGLDKLEENINSSAVSKDMRGYNYITTERLGSEFLNVPAEYADRERKVYTSHVIIEGWKRDPRDWRTNGHTRLQTPMPEVTILLRIKHYGRWDVTKEEYESMRYKVNEFSNRDFREFSPYTTLEHVGMLTLDDEEPAVTTEAPETDSFVITAFTEEDQDERTR